MARILRGEISWADLNPVRVREQMNNVPKTTSSLPKAPMFSADRVRETWQGEYSGSIHEEIVISRAFAQAVFPRTG